MARIKNFLHSIYNWGKIVLPLDTIRYFPPQFILRDPLVQGVRKAFKKGFEVGVVVFNINNLNELHQQLGKRKFLIFKRILKQTIQEAVKKEVPDDEVLVLHDFYSDGYTLFVKVDHDKRCITEIEASIKKILVDIEAEMSEEFPMVGIGFETGYMFIEKNHYSLRDAIFKAHQQALAMAEKRVDTEYNQLVYTMSKIVSKNDISLLAQPIIDVATREIRAWEVLTRGPKGTVYESPLSLFSVARQTNFLYDLEMIVLEKTFEQIFNTGVKHDIFVNFTPLSLGNENFIHDLNKRLAKYINILPKQITIELTERDSIEGIEHLLKNIKALREKGFRIAVDDTGSGYASFSTIGTIMPDIIKIDRSVIQDIDKNTVKESMLKGLLLVAKETGSLVVAEGIENAGEASVLTRNKVELAQGYYFARPTSIQQSLASI